MHLIGIKAKPFLKWVGGKTQLLGQLAPLLPIELKQANIKRYVEPFIGGGAMFFDLTQTFELEESVISDKSDELILAYRTVAADVEAVIALLREMRRIYTRLSAEDQDTFYYELRTAFNTSRSLINFSEFDSTWTTRTAQLLFLNHTCFNGLFRTNAKNEFNVPFGKYRNPHLYDESTLKEASELLRRTEIYCGDFEAVEAYVDERTFIYLDPPYRPISKTASFNGYVRADFGDDEQVRLAAFFRRLHEKGAKVMLSNSDPKNENKTDDFFEELYQGFRITRVKASRAINSNGAKRGQIFEIVITNY